MGKTCSFLRESNPERTKRTPMKILEKSPCNISWLISAIEIPIKYINKIQSFLVMKCKNPRTDTVELGIIEFSKSQEGSFFFFFFQVLLFLKKLDFNGAWREIKFGRCTENIHVSYQVSFGPWATALYYCWATE